MAEEKKKSEPSHISVCRAENGYKICATYDGEKSLASRAGWVPQMPGECKEYVEKTREAVLSRLKELL